MWYALIFCSVIMGTGLSCTQPGYFYDLDSCKTVADAMFGVDDKTGTYAYCVPVEFTEVTTN